MTDDADESKTKRLLRMGPVTVRGDFKRVAPACKSKSDACVLLGEHHHWRGDEPLVTGTCYKCGTLEHERKWDADCFPGQVHAWQPPAGQAGLVARSDEPTDRLRGLVATAAAVPSHMRDALKRRDTYERWLLFYGGLLLGVLLGVGIALTVMGR